MPIITTLQEIEKEFEEKFSVAKVHELTIKQYLRSSHIRLLESLKEELPKEKEVGTHICLNIRDTISFTDDDGKELCVHRHEAYTHNNLLSTIHNIIESVIKQLCQNQIQ